METETLKTYELDVMVKLRRTMRVKAANPDEARIAAWVMLSLADRSPDAATSLSSVLKWTDGRTAYRPMPVETMYLDPETVFTDEEPVEVFE